MYVCSILFLVPPEKLNILNERGNHIPHYILGPYNEGASVNITCVATGGKKILFIHAMAVLYIKCVLVNAEK